MLFMKKLPKYIAAGLAFALSFGIFLNVNLERTYHVGDYVPEEDAYVVAKIKDPSELLKAHEMVTPTDDKYSYQKTRSHSVDLLGNLETVWNSYTGSGTTIAIIDDGFDVDHPEFTRSDGTSAILSTSKYYYTSGNYVYSQSYSSNPSCILEDWNSSKSVWATHGTNTSTTAAAPMGNGGGVGIAPDANILAIKMDFSFGAIREAIKYAVSQNVDVINMSIGAYADYNFTDGLGRTQNPAVDDQGIARDASYYAGAATLLNDACNSAYNKGIIVVAAAGNEATTHKSYPACNTKVIGVGALYKNDSQTLAPFTNYNAENETGELNVDIFAPGYVYTATQGGTTSSSHTHIYDDTQGTSFASPIVAGAACLWKEKNPAGTPDQFLAELQASASGIGDYTSKMIPTSKYSGISYNVGPSNVEQGRINIANLLDVGDPYISVDQSSISLGVGDTKQITLGLHSGTVTYSSDTTSVATVSNTGLVTAIGEGTAIITVTASKNNKIATVNIPVYVRIDCQSLSISPTSVTLDIGDTYNLEETIATVPSNATREFLYESNNESVATINDETGYVTAVGQGSTTIDILALNGDGEATLTVNVNAPTTPTSWVKVTNVNNITQGDYLIVYESGNKAFNGGLTTLDAANNYISVSISNNQIVYSNETAAAKFTINPIEGRYSIRSASGYYIGRASNSNGLDSSTSNVYTNTMSISSGNITINGQYKTLSFNTANDQQRFRYMGSASNIQLYKATSSGEPVPTVSSVVVSPDALNLDLNGSSTGVLSATVNGTNNPSQSVNWSTGNSSVATVENGTVTAVGVGSTIITATSTVDNTKSGTCSVTVVDTTPKTLSSIAISGNYKTSFEVGDTFSFGGTVTAHFSDSSSSNVTASATFSGYNMSVAGNYTVTVSYTYGGTTKTTSYGISVSSSGGGSSSDPENFSGTYNYANKGTAWSLTDCTDQSSYWLCPASGTESIALIEGIFTDKTISSEVVITINSGTYGSGGNPSSSTFSIYNSNACTSQVTATQTGTLPTSKTYTDTIYTISLANASSFTDDLAIKITKPGKQIRLRSITVSFSYRSSASKTIASLSASYTGGDVYVGGSLNESLLTVTAIYTDSVKYPNAVLSQSDYELSGFSSSTSGTKTVTVTYTGSQNVATSPMTTTFTVAVINDVITSISVSSSKTTAHPGETITKSNISLTVNWQSGAVTYPTDFDFATYQFTYADAPSGGTSKNKTFTVNYAGHSDSFNVAVSRIAYVTPTSSTTTISSSEFAGSTISKSSGTASDSNVTVAGIACTVTTNAYIFTTNNTNYLSFQSKQAGSIQNTNAFNSKLTAASFVQKSGARQDGKMYVKTTSGQWTLVSSANFTSNDYRFFKIEYETTTSGSGASAYSNIQSISLSFEGVETVGNVSNYIMYEDTNNQCLEKLDVAITRLNRMSDSDKNDFWSSNDYVIKNARERIQAWARHEGKELSFANGSFQVNVSKNAIVPIIINGNDQNSIVLIAVLSLLGLTVIGSFVYYRRKKYLTIIR